MPPNPSPRKQTELRAAFAAQGLMASFGAELAILAPGRIEISAPIRPEVCQQKGFAHAALSFALGDSAAGFAALSLMPEGADVLTVEMKINLVAPAAGERLVARGEVVRAGRRLSVVKAEVRAERGGESRLVALLQGTMIAV